MDNLAYSQISVPKKFEAEVRDFLEFLQQKEERSLKKKSSDFFGCLDGRLDGMEIQRSMREEDE